MQEVVKIGNNNLQVKVYKGQRVVTFKDIDRRRLYYGIRF